MFLTLLEAHHEKMLQHGTLDLHLRHSFGEHRTVTRSLWGEELFF